VLSQSGLSDGHHFTQHCVWFEFRRCLLLWSLTQFTYENVDKISSDFKRDKEGHVFFFRDIDPKTFIVPEMTFKFSMPLSRSSAMSSFDRSPSISYNDIVSKIAIFFQRPRSPWPLRSYAWPLHPWSLRTRGGAIFLHSRSNSNQKRDIQCKLVR